MIPKYVLKLGLKVYRTNVRAPKIDGSTFETFRMVLAGFLLKNKLGTDVFQKTFLLTDFSIKMVLKMLCLTLSNVNVSFSD